MRREHVVALIVLGWSGSARASTNEDTAIQRASEDLKCDDLRMMHAKNQYAFVGCGKRRSYECEGGKCEDITNRKTPANDATCAVLVSVAVPVAVGCACLAVASQGSVTAPMPPYPLASPCAEVKP